MILVGVPMGNVLWSVQPLGMAHMIAITMRMWIRDLGCRYFITVWKFHDFSITQILREINYGEYRSPKNGSYCFFGALNFVFGSFSAFKKCKKSQKSKFRASKWVKMADLALLESPKYDIFPKVP